MASKDQIIAQYEMQPHPEGGYYAETFKSQITVDTARGSRSASTAIFFLMCDESISRLHRIVSDEVWHFYFGSSITIVELDETTGGFKKTILGPGASQGNWKEQLQYVVKGGTWFGSYPNVTPGSDEFSLVGCTVSPGFEFSDFELGSNAKLTEQFPAAAAAGIIDKMTVGLP
jgi:predicted cupin superfamily sugar epimerase